MHAQHCKEYTLQHLVPIAWLAATLMIVFFIVALPWGAVALIFLGGTSTLASLISYKVLDKRVLRGLRSPVRRLAGTFHERVASRQAAVARIMPSCLVNDVVALILEYEHTLITMSCGMGGSRVLIADDDTMMCLSEAPSLAADIRMMYQLTFRPEVLTPYGIRSKDGRLYTFSDNEGACEIDPGKHLLVGPDTASTIHLGWAEQVTTDGVTAAAEGTVWIRSNTIVYATQTKLKGRRFFTVVLWQRPDGYVLSTFYPLNVVHTKMPDDCFISVEVPGDTVYALTSTGLLYSLPREELATKSPGWSVRPMPCLVRRIVGMTNRHCLALLRDGTLWKLDPEGNVRLPTFSAASRPEDVRVDDVFPFSRGYTVLRYKRFTIEFVPYTLARSELTKT
jgi:hypothetical protein